jgi:hypothetical protein
MTTRKLEKSEWHSFFDAMSEFLQGKVAYVEAASLKLGDQAAAEWLPLIGITYDPRSDVLEVALEEYDHLIQKPREIYLDEGPAGLAGLEVADADGVKHIVQLKEELMLPGPKA